MRLSKFNKEYTKHNLNEFVFNKVFIGVVYI
jgi:hypothetical protein